MNRSAAVPLAAGGLLVAGALAGLAWWWWAGPSPDVPDAPSPAPVAVAPAAPAPAAIAPSAPAAPLATEPGPLPDGDEPVAAALIELLGRDAVLHLLQTDAFAARVAATVDNLPRPHVAPRLWPLNPPPGRFSADADGRIAADNARRYDAALQLLDRLPPAAAAAFYRRLYPQLQAAYAGLGYPGQSFHRRLLEVIDHLLMTPAVSRPLQVGLVDVQGEVPSTRPWVRYEYADPALQSLSAGQRLLLRLGPAHQRRVMDWLRALRPLL